MRIVFYANFKVAYSICLQSQAEEVQGKCQVARSIFEDRSVARLWSLRSFNDEDLDVNHLEADVMISSHKLGFLTALSKHPYGFLSRMFLV